MGLGERTWVACGVHLRVGIPPVNEFELKYMVVSSVYNPSSAMRMVVGRDEVGESAMSL